MMQLDINWQENLTNVYKHNSHKKNCPCGCRRMTIAQRVKEINKLIVQGLATIREV